MRTTPCVLLCWSSLLLISPTFSESSNGHDGFGHSHTHDVSAAAGGHGSVLPASISGNHPERARRLNTRPSLEESLGTRLVIQRDAATKPVSSREPAPEIAKYFQAFEESVDLRWDRDFLYVESSGMPEHPMMTGIVAWQQQVPLPQNYTGGNAWRIPLNPKPASNPMSAKNNFFRGAIALAVNGVPIFNPIKNDGRTDTLLAGELDQWGGHCGRADDYHYHIAPMHLQEIVGKGNPIAFALDGYPIYGFQDPDGTTPKLDALNGQRDAEGNYHYHATRKYPYINGGFYGEVSERGGQVDPQPRAEPVRPAMRPLRGAKVTGFKRHEPNSFSVLYQVNGEDRQVNYSVADDRIATFEYVSPSGTKSETYRPRPAGGRRPSGNRPPAGDRRSPDRGPDGRSRQGPPPNRGGN